MFLSFVQFDLRSNFTHLNGEPFGCSSVRSQIELHERYKQKSSGNLMDTLEQEYKEYKKTERKRYWKQKNKKRKPQLGTDLCDTLRSNGAI